MAKIGRPTYSADEAERVREAAKDLLAKRYNGKNAQLGAALGITGQAIGKFVDGKGGPSVQTVEGIARMKGITPDELLGRTSGRVVEYDARYPNQALGAEVFRREGEALGFDRELVARAINEATGAVHDMPADASPLRWFEHFKAVANGIRYAQRNPAEEQRRREADAARVAEMEEATRPKLPKKRLAK